MTVLFAVGGAAVAIYIALCAFLYVKQNDFLFYPVVTDPRVAAEWSDRRVSIATHEIAIEGWWVRNPAVQNEFVLLYFGGNAEDVLYTAVAASNLHVSRFLTTNYRGYGQTPGRPSEAEIFKDALAVYDYAARQPGISADNIFVMGRSLGSGVATYVAAQRVVRGTILVTPYDSIAGVAQTHYPIFPVSWLLKSKFPSAEFAKNIRVPALILSAEHDVVIPAVHSKRLHDSWAGPKKSITFSGVGHNDIDRANGYYPAINEFLDGSAVNAVTQSSGR